MIHHRISYTSQGLVWQLSGQPSIQQDSKEARRLVVLCNQLWHRVEMIIFNDGVERGEQEMKRRGGKEDNLVNKKGERRKGRGAGE